MKRSERMPQRHTRGGAKILRVSIIALLFSLFNFNSNALAQRTNASSPRAAVEAFVRDHIARARGSYRRAEFNERNIKLWSSTITPELYDALLYELKRTNEFVKTHPGEKPHFEGGDPFVQFSDGYPNAFQILRTDADGERATVQVKFSGRSPAGKWDATQTYEVKRIKDRWLISDVLYEDKGSLLKDLKRAEY